MSNNLANLMVGFGLDLSALQKDAPEAYRILNQQTLGMTAEMKRASREGAESFRLIDEALGIHVSRPLTRILTQEFPAFGKALQSILGVGIVGALGAIGFEAFEKVSKSIEKAMHAQEEWKQSIQKTEDVIQDVGDSYARKIAEANGLEPLTKAAMAGADEAKKAFDRVAAAMDEENKKAIEASKTWTQVKSAIGEMWHEIVTPKSGLQTEELQKQLGTLKTEIEQAFRLDALHGTHDAMKVFQNDLDMAQEKLSELQRLQEHQQKVGFAFDVPGHTGPRPAPITPQQIAAVQQWVDLLKQAMTIETDREKLEGATAAADARAKALKEQNEAAEKLNSLYKEMGSSLAKLQPETDPIKKLDAEISGFRSKAEENFRAVIAVSSAMATSLEAAAALAGLETYEKKLDQLKIKLEGDILAKQAFELLSEKFPGGGTVFGKTPAGTAGAPNFSTTPIVPQLGVGGTAAAQLDVFSNDTLAQNKLVAQAFQEAITPTEEYQLKLQELKLAFASLPDPLKNSAQAQQAFTAALDKLGASETAAELHLQELQKKLDELLSHSTSATDGVKAFFLQLQIQAGENGKFAFDLLNQGLKSFEDELTKAVFTSKAKWEDMFRTLGETAFKFMLQKDVAGFFQMISGTGIGKSLNLPSLVNPGQAAGSAVLTTAATTLQSGSTLLVTAASTLQAAAATLGASSIGKAAGGAGGGFPDILGLIPGFASGTDDAPGGLAWVGEQGPELLNLPGGSSVTPSAALRTGDTTHVWNIDATGNEDVGQRIVRAITQATPVIEARALTAVQEAAKRTLGSR
jgi:hypothetical protein